MKLLGKGTSSQMRQRLERLYGSEQLEVLSERLSELMERYGLKLREGSEGGTMVTTSWSERDVVLISYGDMIQRAGETPLSTLKNFCDRRLRDAVNGVHILPFSPASSDGGFSVIDYRKVAEELGGWAEVESIGRDYELMVDLVLNHCSQESEWFQGYLQGEEPYVNYFIEEQEGQEWLSGVTRPRPHDLLTPVETSRGKRSVWTTFSADQVDLNWKSPEAVSYTHLTLPTILLV